MNQTAELASFLPGGVNNRASVEFISDIHEELDGAKKYTFSGLFGKRLRLNECTNTYYRAQKCMSADF